MKIGRWFLEFFLYLSARSEVARRGSDDFLNAYWVQTPVKSAWHILVCKTSACFYYSFLKANHTCFLNGRLRLFNFRIAVAHLTFLRGFWKQPPFLLSDRTKQSFSVPLINKITFHPFSAVKKLSQRKSFIYTCGQERNTRWMANFTTKALLQCFS